MPRSVLIPVDGSENSRRAFNFYVSDIRHDDDLILLCHIQHTPNLPVVDYHHPLKFPEEEWTNKIREEIIKSQKIIADYEIDCEQAKMAKKVVLGSGKPGEAIVTQATENQANLIVMGSRGQNAVRRTFTGSVSDYVIHHAHIPVLVVPPEHQCSKHGKQ